MSGETKIIYHVDEEETPYLVKIPKPPDQVTLGDFKNVINRPNYKFFFKSMDDDFGVVKEEIVDDDANLPCFNDRVVSWVVAPDDEEGSQNSGEATNLSRKNRDTDAESICSRRSTRSSRSRRYESETESRRRSSRRGDERSDFDTTSMMSSDLEATSFVDSDEDSRMSAITDNSKYSHRQRRRRKKQRMPRVERCSSFSTITESTMSLNIITVVLNMDKINFLGISIVGQANKKGDGGIYVGSVMKGGAVDADGRIEPGDMILAVGDVNFENMSNDDAVRVLRECVHKPGPVMLTVAKCWDPNPKGMFTVPRNDVTRPIDPAAWMQHSEAVRGGLMQGSPSMSTITSTSDSLTSSIPEADRYLDHTDLGLSTQTDMHTIVKVMASAESGLVIRDRMWLKITIKNAFIGSDLVDWLFTHVDGFQDRRDSRKYATKLLKAGLIKHTVKKETFSEQCYYVFGDLNLKPIDDMREAGDMLAPLPNNNQTGTWVGQSPYMLPPGSMMHPMMMAPRGPGSVTSQSEVSTIPPYQAMGAVGGADPPAYAEMYPQMYPGPAAPGQPYNPYFMQATHVGSQGSHHTGSSTGSGGSIRNQNLSLQHQQQMLAQQNMQLQQQIQQQHQQQQMLVRDLDQLTIRSGGSGSEKSHSSRGSRESKRLVISPTEPTSEPQPVELPNSAPQPPQADQTSPTDASISEAAKPPLIAAPPGQTTGEMVRELGKLETFPQEMSASRQSFRMAMGNTNNEFFVDVM